MSDAGRVIAGSARGIRLLAPGPGTRPLADRVKQTLFAVLEPELPGASFLDLFAGSGAGAIEALSRGAAHAVLVERDADTMRVARQNLARTGLEARARIVRSEVLAYLTGRGADDAPFDVVLVDPPYAEQALLTATLERLAAPGLLADGAVVVAKHFWRDAPPPRLGLLASQRARRFGETALTFYRLAGTPEGSEAAPTAVPQASGEALAPAAEPGEEERS